MTSTLYLHPAMGFEYEERWKVAAHQRDLRVREKYGTLQGAHHRLWAEGRMVTNNLSKCVGYCPGCNVIIGIGRIVLHSNENESRIPEKNDIKRSHVYRGMADICCGPLLLCGDVFQTIWDYTVVQEYMKTHKNLPGLNDLDVFV